VRRVHFKRTPIVNSSRRSFFSKVTAAGLGLGIGVPHVAEAAATPTIGSANVPVRQFGRHQDVMVSALGVGGHHLGDCSSSAEASQILHEAVDGGIRFCDNAWEYNNHRSEEYMGVALQGGYRDKVFLMTKVCTHGRDAALAMQMVEESLQRLKTDHLDLWQIHAITYDNDPELAYRGNGVLEACDKAKQQGKSGSSGSPGTRIRICISKCCSSVIRSIPFKCR
jgi:hypothetical protein